ncbi:MAG: hypothetical protein AAGG68_03305 [Bacteroidota bacterium]
MEELKTIWEKVNELQLQIQQMMPVENVESIAQKIEAHEAKRRKNLKLTSRMLISTLITMIAIIIATNLFIGKGISLLQVAGFICVGLGMFYFLFFFHQNTLKASFSDSTEAFVNQTIKLYNNRKKLIITQPLGYTIFLGGGIILILIEYLSAIDGYWGIFGVMMGIMFALTGTVAAFEMKKFEKNEGAVLKQLEHFKEG